MVMLPTHIFKPGDVGVISRSGTLTYEIVNAISEAGLGQSTCIGIGGDPIIGTNMVGALALFQKDRSTKKVVVVGEIGGASGEEAGAFIAKNGAKPGVADVAGRTPPAGKSLGHRGGHVQGGK